MTAAGRAAFDRAFQCLAVAVAVLAILGGAACAARAPAIPPASGPSSGPIASDAVLRDELQGLFATPAFAGATVGVVVQSVDTGRVLFQLNPHTLLVPASNTKILTFAAAAVRLGWDYRYETRLEVLASPRDGVVDGDLFVRGTGDPTINTREGDPPAAFRSWAEHLKATGITRITGRIVGDDGAFADERYGDGWTWDDLVFGYAAPVGALQFNESAVEIVVRPGREPGAPGAVEVRPAYGDLAVSEPAVTTVPAGEGNEIFLSRLPGAPALHVRGTIEQGGEHVARAAVDNPTSYFSAALRRALVGGGITVDGPAIDIDAAADAAALKASADRRQALWTHWSPPLAEIGKILMKFSQNLYAETVFRTLAVSPGPSTIGVSREMVGETLQQWGLSPDQFVVADGSGLSRLNLASAAALVHVLRTLARDDAHRAAFEAALAVAGQDGTLAGRMKATRAEGNAVGKTGTLTRVRTLSGYVGTADGERLAFAFLVNHFLVPAPVIDAAIDQAVERLANFQR